jgi:branched-chain amino acid transport system substrate-binding protein
MNATKKAILAIMLACIILITGCATQPTGKVIEDKETIRIGGLFSLTGAGAFWGEGEKNGALMAINDINSNGGINGKQLEMVIEDGQTSFESIATATKKLVEVDQVDIIIGPTWFGQSGGPLAEQAKKIIISPSAGTDPLPSKYFFVMWPTEEQEIIPVVKHMKENGIKNIALIYNQNDWSVSMKDAFEQQAAKAGITIAKEFATNPDETDYKTIIAKIKEMKADAVYAPFAFYPSQGAFSRQRKEMGLTIPFYSSIGTENAILLESYPEIEGTLYPYLAQSQKEKDFSQRYSEEYGKPASPPIAYAYDAVNLVALALKSGKQTPDEISAFLHEIKDYQGVSNTISFDQNGRIRHKEFIMKTIKDGKFVELN